MIFAYDRERRYVHWVTATLLSSLTIFLLVAGSALAAPSSKPFAIVPGSFKITPSTFEAGAHEDLTTTFDFAHNAGGATFNDVRSTVINLPPGLIGSNTAVPTCTSAQLLADVQLKGPLCPPASQVGTISFELTLSGSNFVPARYSAPLFNMEVTTPGIAAEFGFHVAVLTQILRLTVRPGDLGITVTTPSIEALGEAHNISATVWGVPGSPEHNPERGLECAPEYAGVPGAVNGCINGGRETNISPKPFLTTPTKCGETPLKATIKADSWENPESWSEATTEIAPMNECDRVPFDPSIEVSPTTSSAESSSGLNVSLIVPQSWEKPESLSTSNLENTSVTLPEGITLNPSAGSGLGACTPEQLERETAASLAGEGCPPESKLGSVEIETPVLAEKATGSVYLAKPFDNPFDSLVALYVVAKIPSRGIIVTVAGRVEPNPVTGQLVTTFEENPQVPFSKFTLRLRQGATSPLVTPPTCGRYVVQADLTPWSAPTEPRALSDSFEVEKGLGGGLCPVGGTPPFKPGVVAGAVNNVASAYSPLYLRITRGDGEQELTRFTTILPPGLTGNLSGIPFCPDTAVEAARGASGLHEIDEPSCPAASEIGHTLVGAGVGSVLAWTPGKVYLAGPYHGASFSIVSITSATVGPFDLGTVVIRFALRINPTTAQAEIDSSGSDPIPHIIDGIVVHVRDIHVYVDRSKFILNPTSCDPMSISDTVTGAGADFTNPADQVPVTVTTPFQASDCQSLQFKPTFKVSTSGKTSRVNGASLSVKLSYPHAPQGTQANIRSVKVDLPKQLPSRLTTLQKACPDAIFTANPAACPETSRVGMATATTPILPVPVTGPAYFVSHGGAKFPELIMVLQGYGVTVELHGETFISKQGITSSTLRTVPDVPVGTFELTLPQGRYSALAANGNLCSFARTVKQRKRITIKVHGRKVTVVRTVSKKLPAKLEMPTAFTAQNGMTIHTSSPITVTGCAKSGK